MTGSQRQAIVFLGLAIALAASGLASRPFVGGGAAVPGYAAMSFLFLAVAYAGSGPAMLGKRPDGRREAWAWPLFAPYFLLNALSFWLYRRLTREPPFVEVAPRLYFGRRLQQHEAATLPVRSVLDLAGEFTEVPALRTCPHYRSMPILDATAPTTEQLHQALEFLSQCAPVAPVYVHCALGHGRSACVIIAYLLASGIIQSVDVGEARLKSLRPGVRLHPSQRRLLETWVNSRSTED